MRRLTWTRVAVPALVLAGLALLFAPVSAKAPKRKKQRAASVEFLMEGIMAPNCGGLGKALKGSGPANAKAWKAAKRQASLLNEMSFILMADGRCPDGVWAKAATKTLRGGSKAVLAAIADKDVAAAQAAFKQTTQACAACHKKHKHH